MEKDFIRSKWHWGILIWNLLNPNDIESKWRKSLDWNKTLLDFTFNLIILIHFGKSTKCNAKNSTMEGMKIKGIIIH